MEYFPYVSNAFEKNETHGQVQNPYCETSLLLFPTSQVENFTCREEGDLHLLKINNSYHLSQVCSTSCALPQFILQLTIKVSIYVVQLFHFQTHYIVVIIGFLNISGEPKWKVRGLIFPWTNEFLSHCSLIKYLIMLV